MSDKIIIILLVVIMFMGITMVGGGTFLYLEMKKFKDRSENMENYERNGYADNEFLLKRLLQQDTLLSVLLKNNGVKDKSVQSVTTIKEHNIYNIKDSIINDTLRCINFNKKGISLTGCNGEYQLTQDRRTYVVAHTIRQNKKTGKTKTGPLKFLFKQQTTVNAWTQYGDTLDVKMIQR